MAIQLLVLFLLASITTTGITTAVVSPTPFPLGLVYSPTLHVSPVEYLKFMGVNHIRVMDPSPAFIQSLSGSGIDLFIVISSKVVVELAGSHFDNTSDWQKKHVAIWAKKHILPFYKVVNISAISVGMHVKLEVAAQVGAVLIKAMSRMQIPYIPVSTIISPDQISSWSNYLKLLGVNSPIFITLSPHLVYQKNHLIPIGFAASVENENYFTYDTASQTKHTTLFGHLLGNALHLLASDNRLAKVPVVVAGTGWPCNLRFVPDPQSVCKSYIEGLAKTLLDYPQVTRAYVYEFPNIDYSTTIDTPSEPSFTSLFFLSIAVCFFSIYFWLYVFLSGRYWRIHID